MRMPTASRQRAVFRFNITPMIDVVFLLIIFFLVASYFIRTEQVRAVSLPEAAQGLSDEVAAARRLTVTVEAGGQLSVGGRILSEQQVLQKITSLSEVTEPGTGVGTPEVRIRSDRQTPFRELRRLMEHCAARGISRIRFAVVQPAPPAGTGNGESSP